MRRALVSVSDKNDLVPFVKGLVENDFEIISTGGTKKVLDEAGIKTISVEEVTGFPEILDGRVKTLNPYSHGGLLGRRDVPEHVETMKKLNIHPIDLVCVNLYPFKQTIEKPDCTLADAIENIDIGGPSIVLQLKIITTLRLWLTKPIIKRCWTNLTKTAKQRLKRGQNWLPRHSGTRLRMMRSFHNIYLKKSGLKHLKSLL